MTSKKKAPAEPLAPPTPNPNILPSARRAPDTSFVGRAYQLVDNAAQKWRAAQGAFNAIHLHLGHGTPEGQTAITDWIDQQRDEIERHRQREGMWHAPGWCKLGNDCPMHGNIP